MFGIFQCAFVFALVLIFLWVVLPVALYQCVKCAVAGFHVGRQRRGKTDRNPMTE